MEPFSVEGKAAWLPVVSGAGRRHVRLAVSLLLIAAPVSADVFVLDTGTALALTNVPVNDDFVRLLREEPPPAPVVAPGAGEGGAQGLENRAPGPADAGAARPVMPLAADYPYRNLVLAAAIRHQLPEGLLHGLIKVESNFNPRAVSPRGARGLTQLMPATARRMGVRDAFDPAANIDGGARYLKELLVAFGHDVSLAIAAYNAGPGAVRRYRGIPRYAETIAYVPRVLRAAALPLQGSPSRAARADGKGGRSAVALSQR